jgi:hypothetical protein
MNTTNNKGTLSQETILKIQELKRLVYKYPIFEHLAQPYQSHFLFAP